MAFLWRLGLGVPMLVMASPAMAQHRDNSVIVELQRATAASKQYCLLETRDKLDDAVTANQNREVDERFESRVNGMDGPALEAEESSLRRRILLAEARGDSREDTGPNSLGDLLKRLDTVQTMRRDGTNHWQNGQRLLQEDYQARRREYNDALLNCLEFKDRYPDQRWRDPRPPANSLAFDQPKEGGVGYETMPDVVPEDDGKDHRAWMTGTFDTGGGVMTLNPAGGRYEYANGRMSVTAINGPVMEGVWTQDSSGQQCKDGGYHGRFRLVFTMMGFSGLFGYCDETPAAEGGFHGTRRRD